ncbi:MAG TPA: hypothetical protein VK209_10100 [Candidatus Sulfotelmatobacter sp.]|nr:hypothetical protein [Candidatus Sulfotelmatobacter sp.]
MKLNKTKLLSMIAIVLFIASILLVEIPVKPANAQLAAKQPYIGPLQAGDTAAVTAVTRAFLSFVPNPIGVGQILLVNFWINPALPSNDVIIPDGGYVITITKPDGTKDVKTMRSEPATAANWFQYVPDQVGQYSLKFEFLGTYFPTGWYYNGAIVTNSSLVGTTFSMGNNTISTYFKPSSTAEQSLTVQQDPVWSWPLALPTDYWTRPASMNNRGWWPILGAYPGTGYVGYGYSNWDTLYPNTNPQYMTLQDFTPWVKAPNTAHVLRKQLGAIAGLIGGPAGQYGTTSSPGTPSVIYAGRIYQTMTVPIDGVPTSAAVSYDLRTGEQYYAIPTAAPYNGITPNLVAYVNPVINTETLAGVEVGSQTWSVELLSISGSYLRKINPYTGALTLNVSIAPLSGGTFHNQIGGYVLNIQDLGAAAGSQRYRLINWTTRGTSTNFTSRIISNTTYLRSSLPSMLDYDAGLGGEVTDTYGAMNLTGQPFGQKRWWVSIQFYDLSTGALKYNITTDAYPDILYHNGPSIMDHGKIAAWTQGGYWVIADGRTGKWIRSDGTDYPWSSAGFGAYAASSAYGLLIRYAYNYVYAFNWTDGKLVWKYEAPTYAPFETPYTDVNGTEVYSFNGDGYIADGKLYVANTEHTPTYPLTRGWGIHAINITDGSLLWKLDNPMTYGGVADGYLVAANSWDGYLYVIGKGKSQTTVTAPDTAVPLGTGVMIKGKVLDLSPAQAGTPAVSKDSMSMQMEYLHLGQPQGGLWNNVTTIGVPVSLTALGSDGTVIDVGTATTNGYSGEFDVAWTPPKQDTYQIVASFAGDDSYGSSMSTTAVTVGPAPEKVTVPEQTVPPDYTMTIIGVGIAVIIVVAILVAAAVLILRRR